MFDDITGRIPAPTLEIAVPSTATPGGIKPHTGNIYSENQQSLVVEASSLVRSVAVYSHSHSHTLYNFVSESSYVTPIDCERAEQLSPGI